VGISEKTLKFLLTWQDFRQATSIPPHEDLHCMAGQLYCAIDSDGMVAPCPLQLGFWAGERACGDALEAGFNTAFENLRDNPCKACTSSALTEYNFLYNLNLPSLVEWLHTTRQRTP
jgi:MoaA/NifB/PqqE/SkfB family radical SAM enzyme